MTTIHIYRSASGDSQWPTDAGLKKMLQAFVGDAGLVKEDHGAWRCELHGVMTDMGLVMRGESYADSEHRRRWFKVRRANALQCASVDVEVPEFYGTGSDDFTNALAEGFARGFARCTGSRIGPGRMPGD